MFEDRKAKAVRCHFLEGQGSQDRKVTRGSQVSQAFQLGACLVGQVHKAFLVLQDTRVIVALDTLVPQDPQGLLEKMEIRVL